MILKEQNMRILLTILLLVGCAIQNPSLNNVKGNWESTGLLYQRIEIDGNGKGYFAAGLNDKIECCAIKKISFKENESRSGN